MAIFVTGSTGHVGANLVRALLADGEDVRVLLREGSDHRAMEGLPVEVAHGDLSAAGALAEAMEGCDRVYHLAAMISIRDMDREKLFQVNVEGTKNVLEAARKVGVARMVHCSTFGTIGHNPRGPSDESFDLDPDEAVMHYDRTKLMGEMEVRRAAREGFDVTIVNPTGIVGPHDYKPSLIGRSILDFAAGRLPAYVTVSGAFDFVPVRDVVAGHRLAMERGRRGERYLLSGELASMPEIFGWLAEFVGRPAPPIKLPPWLLAPVAQVKDAVERRFFPAHSPKFTAHSVRLLGSRKHGSNRKAVDSLGLEPTPLRDAFSDAVDWFRQSGHLPRA